MRIGTVTMRWTRAMGAAAMMLALFAANVEQASAQTILRDAETEALLNDLSRPLIKAAGLDPANVQVVLVADPTINAFSAGGQVVYLNTGLVEAADNANEIQGVIAHELGHIADGHILQEGAGEREATGITLLSLILGVAAAAAGGGEAGLGVAMAGQRAALGKYLQFSRVQEATADASGAKYLSIAGISGRGSISFFKKLENLEMRMGIPQDEEESFIQTHPLSKDRIAILEDVYRRDPAWNKPIDPALQARFLRVKAKLVGYVDDPDMTLRKYPLSDNSIPARYARAYAWHKAAYPQKAYAEARGLVDQFPDDPYFLELYGQILLESGKPAEALTALRKATQLTRNQPLIATTFGHALVATEQPSNYPEAVRVLKAAVARDEDNPFAWYELGTAYTRMGDDAHAALATAETNLIAGNSRAALSSATTAMAGLTENSPDWLRAQDIKLVAEAALEKDRHKRRSRGFRLTRASTGSMP